MQVYIKYMLLVDNKLSVIVSINSLLSINKFGIATYNPLNTASKKLICAGVGDVFP